MSVASLRMTSKSWELSSSGRTVHTQAAAPATSGDAKLVPAESVAYPLGSTAIGSARRYLDAGAGQVHGRHTNEKAAT